MRARTRQGSPQGFVSVDGYVDVHKDVWMGSSWQQGLIHEGYSGVPPRARGPDQTHGGGMVPRTPKGQFLAIFCQTESKWTGIDRGWEGGKFFGPALRAGAKFGH